MTSTKTKKQKQQTRKEEALEKAREAYRRTMQAMKHTLPKTRFDFVVMEDKPKDGMEEFCEAYEEMTKAISDYVKETKETDTMKIYNAIKGENTK